MEPIGDNAARPVPVQPTYNYRPGLFGAGFGVICGLVQAPHDLAAHSMTLDVAGKILLLMAVFAVLFTIYNRARHRVLRNHGRVTGGMLITLMLALIARPNQPNSSWYAIVALTLAVIIDGAYEKGQQETVAADDAPGPPNN